MCQLNNEYQIHLEMCELFMEKICQIETFRRNALEAKKKITIINSRLTNLNKLVFLYQIICPPLESELEKYYLSHFSKLMNA